MTVEAGQTARAEPSAEAAALRANWNWFAMMFAINHGVVTTPLVISTSVLNESVGYIGNALLNISTVVSALLLGATVVHALGLRGGVLFGMGFYCLYAGLFVIAAVAKDAVEVQWVTFCAGSVCAGIAAGVLWTSQGGYFSRTVDLILEQEPESDRAAISAKLAGQFAFVYLGFEVAAKLLWAFLDWVGMQGWIIAIIFTLIGVGSLLLQMRARALDTAQAPAHWTSKVKAAAFTWRDPVIFLLGGLNITFGFCAAFMNGYVNANYTSKQLGSFAVAMLAAFTALTAAVMSKLFGPLSARIGKGPLVFLGSFCFLCIPLSIFLVGCCAGWGWWLVVLYLLQGMGRAIFESTNKGVFADFFPRPEDSVGAFANVMLQVTLAFALCFFLSGSFQGRTLGLIVAVLALLTPLGFLSAKWLRHMQAKRAADEAKMRADGEGAETEGSSEDMESNSDADDQANSKEA